MSAISGRTRGLVSAIFLGCFLVGVQSRQISQRELKREVTEESKPSFDRDVYTFSIPEDTPVGTTIGHVPATEETDGETVYSFASQTQTCCGRLFQIDAETGEITLKSPVDFELENVYVLSVMAKNPNEDSVPAEVLVEIRILDINDNAPRITINTVTYSGEAEVEENTVPGTFVAHITVFDPDSGDNGRFSCELDDDHFRLAKLYDKEFKIVTAEVFDREAQAQYHLPIKCQDHGEPPQTSVEQLSVNIVDVNDNVPMFERSGYRVSIPENNIVGQAVFSVQVFDADTGRNADIHYALDQPADNLFKVDPASGVISTQTRFDYENTPELTFNVLASDLGSPPLTSSAQVKVTIIDVNDNEPVFDVESYLFEAKENITVGTVIGHVHARDKDSGPYGEIVYSFGNRIQTGHSQLFHIDAVTGEITVKVPEDFEDGSIFTFSVMAKNPDEDFVPAEVSVKIMILDVNDNSPEITSSSSSLSNFHCFVTLVILLPQFGHGLARTFNIDTMIQ